ncbi:uncharacterized protein F4822DRAFT_37019 [Hypoxylon trugodes]|uniref:uncharacterized protein n=1 Tax=Hypoxylon trugodes TaxID=326681 RepID=UPI00219E854F|nr:uncharacterized protein F4822DRAFT_37019 [Hypoxylon trugodes]KAI1394109.1 hypothetical protein F4822DRAFT_37019 [Hypoxylon trugodes]
MAKHPADPRTYLPSRAHPEHRSHRKQLEKEHPFSWTEPLVLGMLGVGLAWNIEKQVRKHEERKEREGQDTKDRDDRRRRRRERQIRDGSFDPSRQDDESNSSGSRDRERGSERERGSDRGSVARDTVDLERSRRRGRSSRRDRVQSVDTGHHDDPRYIEDDRYYEQSRYDRASNDTRYNPYIQDDAETGRGRDTYSRSRRDSW